MHDDTRKNALLHFIGDEAYDIFEKKKEKKKRKKKKRKKKKNQVNKKEGVGSVTVEGEANEYETLEHSFTTYFTPKQNCTYEM